MRISDWSSDVCSSDLSTTTGIAIDLQDLTARMPLGRSLTDAALLAPTATAGDTTFGNLASLGGASVAENAYYINGLNITNFDNYLGSAPVPFEFFRSVEVKTDRKSTRLNSSH